MSAPCGYGPRTLTLTLTSHPSPLTPHTSHLTPRPSPLTPLIPHPYSPLTLIMTLNCTHTPHHHLQSLTPHSHPHPEPSPAASEGNLPVTKLLVEEAKANIDSLDRWGGSPLADAVRQGHGMVGNFLISAGAKLGWDELRTSAELCELARQGDGERLGLLLSAGCQVDACDYDQRTALHVAASEGRLNAVTALLDSGATVDVRDRWGGTPLRDAARGRHLQAAEVLLRRGGTLGFNEAQASGELCDLAREGSLDVLKLMLRCGASVNAADYDSRTCLHLAASEGNLPIVTHLIETAKADTAVMDRWQGTPLADAVRQGHAEVVKTFIRHGAQLGWDQARMAGELCEIARQGDVHRVDLLLLAGCKADAADYDLRTALHVAACESAMTVAQTLISHGATIDRRDRWGGTPLRDACRGGHMGVARLLLSHGGTLAYTNLEEASVLNILAFSGHSESLSNYAEVGANVNVTDWDGRTALHVAASAGHKSTVKALIEAGAKVGHHGAQLPFLFPDLVFPDQSTHPLDSFMEPTSACEADVVHLLNDLSPQIDMSDRWGHTAKDGAERAGVLSAWDEDVWTKTSLVDGAIQAVTKLRDELALNSPSMMRRMTLQA